MAITLSDYVRELAQAKDELETLQSKLQELTARESELAKVVQWWQVIIALKRKQSGELAPTEAIAIPELGDSSTVHGEEEEGENKTQFVREYIRAHAGAGTTPEDLKRAARNAGMKHPPSWPYGALQRLKKKGEISKRRGKFYPLSQPDVGNQPNLALVG